MYKRSKVFSNYARLGVDKYRLTVYNGGMRKENKVKGFINETHTSDVEKVFGKQLAEKLAQHNEEKTFLQILVENGQFDLTNKKVMV